MKNTRCDECGRQLGGPNGGHRIGCNFDTSIRPSAEQVANEEQDRRKRLASYAVVYTTPLQTQEVEHTKTLDFSKTGVNQLGDTIEQFARKNVADCTGGYGFLVSVTKIADLVPEAK